MLALHSMPETICHGEISLAQGLNQQPLVYKSDALRIELIPANL